MTAAASIEREARHHRQDNHRPVHSRRAAARGGNPAIVTVNDPLAQVDEDTTVAALLHVLG
jgi:hypothetical protein